MKKIKKNVMLYVVAFILIFCIWLYWGNTFIQTTYVNINSDRIPAEFYGFTIVQVSDLHNSEFGSHQTRLLNAVKAASPDIITVTGDLIDSSHTNIEIAMEFIVGAVKIAPVYFVTGNHEAWSDQYEDLKQQMIDAGVIILNDESTAIQFNGNSIQLLGLNDPDFTATDDIYESAYMIDTKLKSMLKDTKEYTILLSHRPELFDVYSANNIDLILSGHAHGGQIRLPFIGGLIAPNQGFFPQYYEGVYKKEHTNMIVSRGLGNSIIPLRINNPPELVVITLDV